MSFHLAIRNTERYSATMHRYGEKSNAAPLIVPNTENHAALLSSVGLSEVRQVTTLQCTPLLCTLDHRAAIS
jgi:hypothetical protein